MISTEKLYEQESASRRFCGRVLHVDGNVAIFDQTLFYPTGGGQPCDHGMLFFGGRAYEVTEVRKSASLMIEHVLAQALPSDAVGQDVNGEVDDDLRLVHTRLHTALHVLTAVVQRSFSGTLVTGAQIKSDGTARMDFDLEGIPKSELHALEGQLQAELAAARVVRTRFVTEREATEIPNLFRSRDVDPPAPDGRIRVVEIDGLDVQACGGTHTASTEDCGSVYFKKVYSKGRGNRRIVIALRDMA